MNAIKTLREAAETSRDAARVARGHRTFDSMPALPRIFDALADWFDYEADREAYNLAEFGFRSIPDQAKTAARAVMGES